MNNVSVRNKLITYFIMSILPFLFLLLKIIFQELYSVDFFIFVLFITPVWLFYWVGNLLLYLNAADIEIDEKNNTVIIKSIFSKKTMPINELQINRHITPRRLAFIFYNNKEKIILNYTQQNYNIIIRIFEITNYKYTIQFKEYVKKRASIFDLK